MIWLLLLPLMLKGTNGETLTTSPLSNQIIVPLDPDTPFSLANCKERSVMVEFQHLRVHGIEYTRKVLSSEDEECASGDAIPLLASDFPGCAKEAAAKGLNSFYFDDEGQCVSSNRPVLNEEGSCPVHGKVVYSTNVLVSNYTAPPANINNFNVEEVNDGTAFLVNFEVPCSAFYEFRLSHEDEDLGLVRPGGVVPFNVPRCSSVTLTLTPSFGGEVGVLMNASYAPKAIADVVDFAVGNFTSGTSFEVYFKPVCPGDFEYMLEIDGELVDDNVFPQKEIMLRGSLSPCTELTFTLKTYDKLGNDAGKPVEITATTPAGGSQCFTIGETDQDFSAAASFCTTNNKNLINSKDLLSELSNTGRTGKFWVHLGLRNGEWYWGPNDDSVLPTDDSLWSTSPSTTGPLECAVYDLSIKQLTAVDCEEVEPLTACY